jgi:hypothetical protein
MKAKLIGIMLLVAMLLVGVGTAMAADAGFFVSGALIFPDPKQYYDVYDEAGNVTGSAPAFSAWEEFWVLIPEYAGAESYNARVWIIGPSYTEPFVFSLYANPGWHEVVPADANGLLDADDGAGTVFREYHLWAEDQYAYIHVATATVWYRLFIDATTLQSYQFHYISVVPETFEAVLVSPLDPTWYTYKYTPMVNPDGSVPAAFSDIFVIANRSDPYFPVTYPANVNTQR